jgi:uncharacterized protein (DUF427 family)
MDRAPGEAFGADLRTFTVTDTAHTVRIKANLNRVRATFKGQVIAETSHALTVLETGLNPVQYFPRDDVRMDYLSRTKHQTHCPFKGEASYYTVLAGDEVAENAVWTYEDPIKSVLAIKGYLAFYPNKLEVQELGPSEDESPVAHP